MRYKITGGYTQIDTADVALAQRYQWHVNDSGYAVWRGIKDGEKKTVRLHRLITNCPADKVVDHVNHDRLDNRRRNLRVGTHSDNMRNLTNQGKGYWYQKKNRNWVVEINGRHRGTFPTEAEAADFAKLVRAGLADKKPREVPTHCKHGHSLADAYVYNGHLRCKTCQSMRSAAYYVRRNSK